MTANSTNISGSAAASPGLPLRISPVATTEPQSTSSMDKVQVRATMTQAVDEIDEPEQASNVP